MTIFHFNRLIIIPTKQQKHILFMTMLFAVALDEDELWELLKGSLSF
jgi:hypothetical protein